MAHDSTSQLASLEGQPLPALKLKDWTGGIDGLDALKGKIVVIDFWATWCHPCLAQIPRHNKIMDEFGDQGVAVLGICATTGAELMQSVVNKRGIRYTVARDVDKASERALGVRWFPSLYLVDREGIIREAAVTGDRIDTALRELLAEQPLE
jgi:peroxiredoxin